MFGNRTISRRYCCLVLLPDEKEVREAVMDTLNEEQKSFPLDILVQTGNRRVSRRRIVVEHGIGKMKVWRVAAERFRNPLRRHTLVMKNVAGLHNLMFA